MAELGTTRQASTEKRVYATPELEQISFAAYDVLTASSEKLIYVESGYGNEFDWNAEP